MALIGMEQAVQIVCLDALPAPMLLIVMHAGLDSIQTHNNQLVILFA